MSGRNSCSPYPSLPPSLLPQVWTVEQYITGYDRTWGVALFIFNFMNITDTELDREALQKMAVTHKENEARLKEGGKKGGSAGGGGAAAAAVVDLRALPTFRALDDGETPLLLMRFVGQRLITVVNASFEKAFFSSAEIEAQREAASMILEFVLAKVRSPPSLPPSLPLT